MEHIVQFAVGIDDNAIAEHVSKNAEKEIIKDLKQQVANRLFEPYYYKGNVNLERDPLSEWAKEKIINTFLEENKDKIISETAKELAAKLARSKAGKAILEDLK